MDGAGFGGVHQPLAKAIQLLTGNDMGHPRLGVAVGGRLLRLTQDVFNHLSGDGLGQESPDGAARLDGVLEFGHRDQSRGLRYFWEKMSRPIM